MNLAMFLRSIPWVLVPEDFYVMEGLGNDHQWQLYCEGLKNFLAFREGMELPAVWLVPVDQLKEFLVIMETQDLPPTKSMTYMEGLSFISKMVDHPDPLQDPTVCHMILRLKCRTAPLKDKNSPVITEVLRPLLGTLESVCSSPYEHILFCALFAVAFWGALCTEEILANHRNVVQPELLHSSDLQLSGWSANLCLHTSHIGQERPLVQLGLSREMWICPIEALCVYVAAWPQGEGPLFVHLDSRPVTKREFPTVFQCALRLAGHLPNQYGVHSFWLEALVHDLHGYSDEAIDRIARW